MGDCMKKLGASITIFSTIFTIIGGTFVISNQYKEASYNKAKNVRVVTTNHKNYDLEDLYSIQKANDPIYKGPIYTCIKKKINMKETKKEDLELFGLTYFESYEEIPSEIVASNQDAPLKTFPNEPVETKGYFVVPRRIQSSVNGEEKKYTTYYLITPSIKGYFSVETGELVVPVDATVDNAVYHIVPLWNATYEHVKPWDSEELPLEKAKVFEKKHMKK